MPLLNPAALDVMSRQLQLLTRQQAWACGLTEDQLDGHVRRGSLVALHRGTYTLPGARPTVEQRILAAVLRSGLGARASGPAVLGMFGVEGFGSRDPFEVLVPRGRTVTNVGFTVVPDPAPGADHARLGCIPAVTATRGLLESARTIRGRRLRVGIDSAQWLRLTTLPKLERRAQALGHHEGAMVVAAMIADGVFNQESEGERDLADFLATFDLPPLWQHWVTPRIRVDAVWLDVRLVLEYDGAIHQQEHIRIRDHERERELRRLGFVVVRITAADLRHPQILRARLLGLRDGLLARRPA